MKSISLFFSTITAKGFLLTLTPIMAMMMNSLEAAIGLAILITLDLFTGVKKYLYINKIKTSIFKKSFWLAIKSEGLRNTWKKTREYTFGILGIFATDAFILKVGNFQVMERDINITTLAITIAAVIELWSNYENIEATGGINILKKAINFLPNGVKDFFKKTTEK